MQETALVTGAAHGIGLAITERLARDGFRVLASDADGEALLAHQPEWIAADLTIEGRTLDVTDRARVRALLDAESGLDVTVNNAGVGGSLEFLSALTRKEVARVMEINLLGAFRVAQESARRMKPGGRIINIASRGYLGGAGAAHYVASKAGIVGMTRAMAVELRWMGLRVNAIAPGLIDTRALDMFGAMREGLEALEPAGIAAEPAVIADVVSFLCSPAARFMNGEVLLVDGGKSVGCPPL